MCRKCNPKSHGVIPPPPIHETMWWFTEESGFIMPNTNTVTFCSDTPPSNVRSPPPQDFAIQGREMDTPPHQSPIKRVPCPMTTPKLKIRIKWRQNTKSFTSVLAQTNKRCALKRKTSKVPRSQGWVKNWDKTLKLNIISKEKLYAYCVQYTWL